jgi:hypothetical protein
MDINSYLVQLHDTLSSISDIENQKITWTGSSNTQISSFTEELSYLYDILEFDLFVESLKERTDLIDRNLSEKLRNLHDQISDFKDTGYAIELERNGFNTILQSNE